MNRILIVITRMYAEKGGEGDEFVELWMEEEEAGVNEEYRLFPAGAAADCPRRVLVLHGYDYPDNYSKEVTERAAESIRAALAAVGGAGEAEIGVAFHAKMEWEPSEGNALARELEAELRRDGCKVKFAAEYRHGALLQKEIAPLCREGEEFSEQFDRQWEYFSNVESKHDNRMGEIRHKIINKLSPVEKELEAWKADGFEREAGLDLLGAHGGGSAPRALDDAMHLVLESSWHADTVANIVESVLLKADAAAKKKAINDSFEKLKGLFEGGQEYQKMKEVMAEFGAPPGAGDSEDARLERLRKLLAPRNHYKEWYDSMLAAFDRVRKALGQ